MGRTAQTVYNYQEGPEAIMTQQDQQAQRPLAESTLALADKQRQKLQEIGNEEHSKSEANIKEAKFSPARANSSDPDAEKMWKWNNSTEITPKQPQTSQDELVVKDLQSPDIQKYDQNVEGMNRLEDFELERTIGTGSFGRVHLARNIHTCKYYALKVLGKTQIVEMNQVDHALNEKRIIRQLSHPFLVHCYSAFHDPQNLYFVLEYVHGGELFSYLRQSGRFENKVAQFYSSEVVSAFEYMHNIKILYRDLKPENILINSDGHIKITDFGFAKFVPDVTWTLCGTPDYLAPEIIQSKAYGAAADWWSLGVFIYEMLAGYPPFYDENPIKLYEKILACKVVYSVNFAPEAVDLVSKLLCLDLTKRYGNLKGGVDDIKNHPWYADIDWEKVKALQVTPPYIPKVSCENDTSYFSTYAERPVPYNPNCLDIYTEYFKEF